MTWVASWQATRLREAGSKSFDTEGHAMAFAHGLVAGLDSPTVVIWELEESA